ncbi:uncharacterized protein LOC129914169 [Episyrphus balteatus]|uniref:uncharacterized protein LOC129914169 n=1 Tax=Episyrphus balteatus TaxID=286459 RepID=UPI002486BF29|nr:uncharacterized protein LOC129914169 [Episyrphus balteatus]
MVSPLPYEKHEVNSLNAVSMKDISNAMAVITNDTKKINQLIPKLFNVNDPNPAYVFRLPRGTKTKYNILTMHRNNFDEPIFPNLTTSYVHLMRSRGKISESFNGNSKTQLSGNSPFEDRVHPNLVEEDESILVLNLQTERNFIEYLNKVNQIDETSINTEKDVSDEWSSLGLHGWKGILSKDKEKQQSYVEDNEPEVELEWDLPAKMRTKLGNNILQVMKNNNLMQIVENLPQQSAYPVTSQHRLHSDGDVYIGRVNDPFGHSTKWNQKNSTSKPLMEDRKKRGVIELYSMIKCSTGCDPIIFKGYGCYCGFLGDGLPVDGIDRCCRLHDKCYEYSNCIPYLEYFVPYIWKCYRGKPLCAIDHGEWGGPQSCAARLCQCDLRLSRCLRHFFCPHRRAICRTSKTRILQNLLINF